jgi:hypothetical protein
MWDSFQSARNTPIPVPAADKEMSTLPNGNVPRLLSGTLLSLG